MTKPPVDRLATTGLKSAILPKGAMPSATLVVRRCAPVLSQMDARLLQLCNYESPLHMPGNWGPRAKKLVKLGLLETDPSAREVYRQTDAGRTVLERFYHLGWLERPKKGTKP